MNFIFVSPNFPFDRWRYCDRLKRNGVNVLAIGDAPYFTIEERLRDALTEYYFVESLSDYDQVYRAVAFYAFKYGRIDWLESNNDFWLAQDGRLRTDFHIVTGAGAETAALWADRMAVRDVLRREGIPTVRRQMLTSPVAAKSFLSRIGGYPLLLKPNNVNGVRATVRIQNDEELRQFLDTRPDESFVLEEELGGDFFTYHAITGSGCEPLFESLSVPGPDPRTGGLSSSAYCASTELAETLRSLGRRVLSALGVRSRFVRVNLCRLTEDRPPLGKAGEFVVLLPHMAPAGGYIPDLINFAHSTDVYQIWADMVTEDRRVLPEGGSHRYCCCAGRREDAAYAHSHEDITVRYWQRIVFCENTPEQLWDTVGHKVYAAYADDVPGAKEFMTFVSEPAG